MQPKQLSNLSISVGYFYLSVPIYQSISANLDVFLLGVRSSPLFRVGLGPPPRIRGMNLAKDYG